jgi:hypothetical protein
LTRAPGAGHGEAGDAPLQGPAQEDVLSVQPKSANPNEPANAAIAIFETTPRDAGLVMTRPKPEKRKNAKERAKAKFAKEKTTEDGTTPMTATAKSEVESKAERKAATKVASKAAKAERKAKRSAAKAA